MKLNRASMFAAGAVTALVLGGGSAYAATGGTFILGRSNTATTTTTLTNSAGVPLTLMAKSGYAPLAVNSTRTVTRLSSDLVDGLDSTAFLRSTARAANSDRLDGLDNTAFALAAGRTGIIYGSETDADNFVNTAACPAGTTMTGGGGFTEDGLAPNYSGPDLEMDGTLIPNSWWTDDDSASMAFVSCYNPRGAVPGAATKDPTAPAATAAGTARGSVAGFGAQKPSNR